MKLAYILLAIALIVPMGCNKLSLDDPKVVELEAELAKAKETIAKLEAANTRLQDEKAALEKENKEIKEDLVEVLDTAEYFSRVVKEVVPDKVLAIYKVPLDNNKLYNKPAAAIVAKDVLELARKHDFKVKIKVEGYSTHVGDAKHNMWLSKERAEGVFFKIMGMAGSDATKFSHTHVIAHGEESDNERKVVVTVEVL